MYSLVIIAAFQAVLEAFLIPVFVSKQPSDMDEQSHQSDQLKRPKEHKKLLIFVERNPDYTTQTQRFYMTRFTNTRLNKYSLFDQLEPALNARTGKQPTIQITEVLHNNLTVHSPEIILNQLTWRHSVEATNIVVTPLRY